MPGGGADTVRDEAAAQQDPCGHRAILAVTAAEAATCDAVLTPIVSGQIDGAILDQLTGLFLHATRHDQDQDRDGGQGRARAQVTGRAATRTVTRPQPATASRPRTGTTSRTPAATARQATAPVAGHQTAAACPPCRNGPVSCPPPPGNGSATPSCS